MGVWLEPVGNFLVALATAGMLVGVIAFFYPLPALKIGDRRRAVTVLAGSLALGMVGALFIPEPDSEPETAATTTTTTPQTTTTTVPLTTTTTETEATATTAPPTTTTVPPTPESSIESRIRSVLGDDLVRVDIVEQFDGGYGVDLTMNVSENLTMNLTAVGFEDDAGEIMTALYADEPDLEVRWVAIEGLFPLRDRYGNTAPGRVVEILFPREEAEKVNWDYDYATLRLDILPGLYDWRFIHPELREYLP